MISEFYDFCKQNSDLKQILTKDNLFNVFAFGEAPQGVKSPYIVYQTISGAPFYAINHSISHDVISLQIDIYSENQPDVINIFKIIKKDLTNSFIISRYNGLSREFDTRLYRASFDLNYIGD